MYEKHFLIDFILNLPKKGQVFDNQSLADMLSAIGKMNPSLFVNIVHSIATYDKEVERVKKIYNSNDYEYEIKNRKINSLELFRPYSFCSYFSDIFETLFEHYGQRLPDEIMALFTDFDTSYFVSSDLKKDFKEKLIQSILKPQTISYTQAIEKHIDKLVHVISGKKVLDYFTYNNFLSYAQLFHLDKDFIVEQNQFNYPSSFRELWPNLNYQEKNEQFKKHIDDICQPLLYSTYSTLYLSEQELISLYTPFSFVNKVGLDCKIFIKAIKENYELKKHGLSLGDKKIKKFTPQLFDSIINFYCNAQAISQSFFDVCKELNIHVGHSLYYLPTNQKISHFIEQEMAYENTELFNSIHEFLNKNKAKQDEILEYFFDTHFENYTKLFDSKGALFKHIQNHEKYQMRLPHINNLISLLELEAQLEKKETKIYICDKLSTLICHLNEVNMEKEALFLLPLNYNNIKNKDAIMIYEQWRNISSEMKQKYYQSLDLYKADLEKAVLSYQMNQTIEIKAKIKI